MGSNKIESVFEWAMKQQITFADTDKKIHKKNNSSTTWKNYTREMKAYENWLIKEKGLKDITRAKPKHGIEYMEMLMEKNRNGVRGGSVDKMNAFIHGLHALQSLCRESGVFRGLKLGNKEDLKQMKNDNGFIRKSDETSCLKANENDFKVFKESLERSKSPQKETIITIAQIQRGVGCRISEAIDMKKEDITINKDGTAIVYIKGKGGLERWVEVRDKETVKFLKETTEDKKGGSFVVQIKDRDGNDKTHEKAIAQAMDVMEKAGERAGLERNGAKYTSHSNRKVFAQEQVDKYAKMSMNQLERELARRIREFPRTEDGRNKLKEQKDSELTGIRNKIRLEIKGRRTKEEGLKLRKEREFNHKELVLFLASIDTGHFRVSIMRYYAVYPKDKKK